MLKGCTIIEDVASVACCINTQLRTSNHVEYTRCNIVMLMAATALLLLSFSTCIVCGFDSYAVLFKCPQRKSPPPSGGARNFRIKSNQIRPRYRNWRTSAATQLRPSKSLCYIGYTSTWWQRECWLTVQTLYAICILTTERISQGHMQNGRWATFSWPTLYLRED